MLANFVAKNLSKKRLKVSPVLLSAFFLPVFFAIFSTAF